MKTVWIVDGAYVNYFKGGKVKVDYLKLKAVLEAKNNRPIDKSYYFIAVPNLQYDGSNEFYRFLERSTSNGGLNMEVKIYQFKNTNNTCPSCKHKFSRPVQKGVDVGIATLIIKLASEGCYDRLILTAGDGDFYDAILYVKSSLQKDFWVNGYEGSLSDGLSRLATEKILLDDLTPQILLNSPSNS